MIGLAMQQGRLSSTWIPLLTLTLLLTPAALQATGPAPAGKTYFVLTVGTWTPFDIEAGCMVFRADSFCFVDGPCGVWAYEREGNDGSSFRFEIEHEVSGIPLRIQGNGSADARGSGVSLGGSAAAELAGARLNLALAGRSVARNQCKRLAEQWRGISDAWGSAQCLTRAAFDDPVASPYVLPYSVGSAYRVSQSYCDPSGGSHRSKFAYDFDLPIGTPVIAARDGVVWMGTDQYLDGDRNDHHENSLFVEHADGSVAGYAHLKHASLLVGPGDRVRAGQVLAASGDTGTNQPHLHFHVQRKKDLFEEKSMPVNFRNTAGALDQRGGLINGQIYEALPY